MVRKKSIKVNGFLKVLLGSITHMDSYVLSLEQFPIILFNGLPDKLQALHLATFLCHCHPFKKLVQNRVWYGVDTQFFEWMTMAQKGGLRSSCSQDKSIVSKRLKLDKITPITTWEMNLEGQDWIQENRLDGVLNQDYSSEMVKRPSLGTSICFEGIASRTLI